MVLAADDLGMFATLSCMELLESRLATLAAVLHEGWQHVVGPDHLVWVFHMTLATQPSQRLARLGFHKEKTGVVEVVVEAPGSTVGEAEDGIRAVTQSPRPVVKFVALCFWGPGCWVLQQKVVVILAQA